jgi:hypothetical protein
MAALEYERISWNGVAEWKLDRQLGKWVAKLGDRSLCFVDWTLNWQRDVQE